MPRIYASNADPIDFCKDCFPDEETAEELFGVEEYGLVVGEDRDGFGYDCNHPPYDDTDYECWDCGAFLGPDDDLSHEAERALKEHDADLFGWSRAQREGLT